MSSVKADTLTLSISAIPQGYWDMNTHDLRMKDTITVIVREQYPPYAIVEESKGVFDSLRSNSYYQAHVFLDNIDFDSLYWIVVKHRNSIETWTYTINDLRPYPPFFIVRIPLSAVPAFAYNNNQARLYNSDSSYYNGGAMYSGDVNQDGFVDLTDNILIYNDMSNFVTGYVPTDLTGDRIVDLNDLNICYNNLINNIQIQRP